MRSPSRAANCGYARIRRARPLLGTVVQIEVGARRPVEALHAAVDDAFSVMAQVHALMSFQDPDSELSRLNRCAAQAWQQVDPRTHRVLAAALRFARLSGGAFDPCVAAADASATWRDVQLLSDNSVRYQKPLSIDLSGIAKGFAVDEGFRKLTRAGLEEVMVNAGGDLRFSGARKRRIGLRDPRAPSRLGHELILQNAALATSATYYSMATSGDRRVSALIDGRSRKPYAGDCSVSVRAGSCMCADALTKVVLFADRELSEYCLASFDAEAYMITDEAA